MKVSLGRFRKTYDIAVVGAGAAGISAAINAAARNKSVVVFEAEEPMGKIRRAPEIRNYPGIPGATGEDVARAFLRHALEMGVEIKKGRVGEIVKKDSFLIYTPGDRVEAGSVILAVGIAKEKKLPGEEELLGQGVSYCVTCDGAAYTGARVLVIAESEEGEEEARALVRDYGCRVTYVPLYEMRNGGGFKVMEAVPRALRARGEEVEVDFGEKKLLARGVFLIRRVISPASLIKGLRMRDGFIEVNRDMETNIPGVFAAGDCTGAPFQIAKAAGEGQVAALRAVKYLSALEEVGE